MLMNSDARVVFRLDVLGENAVRATIEFANVTETAVDLQEVVIADKAQEIEIEDPEQDKTIQRELEEIKEVISTRATELWRSAQQWFSTSRSLLKESYAAKKVAMGPVLQTVSELKEDTAAREGGYSCPCQHARHVSQAGSGYPNTVRCDQPASGPDADLVC